MSGGKKNKAVILLSGGLDSSTCLAMAKNQGFECYALTFSYGQRHSIELKAAGRIAESLGAIEHIIFNIDLCKWGGSALTSSNIKIPKNRRGKAIPVTYVPARNIIFLSAAVAWAEALGAKDIFIGVNSIDYSGYPDCRPEFIKAFEKCANSGTKAGSEGRHFTIHTPLQKLDKSEIITLGTKLGVDYAFTHSCYDPDKNGRACGRCDSCVLRKKGFEKAGIPDPAIYQ